MVSDVYDKLVKTLSAEKDVYAALLELSLQKNQAVILGDLEGLHALLEREAALQEAREEASEARTQASLAMERALGVPHDQATLRRFTELLPSRPAAELEALRAEFSALMNQLGIQIEANSRLIQVQIDNIRATLEVMSQTSVLGNQYTRTGAAQENLHRVSILDTSV